MWAQVRDEHLGLKLDQTVWIGVSYQKVPTVFVEWWHLDVIFHLLTFAFTFLFPDQDLGFRYQYNLMDAGLMLNLPPNVTRQRGVDCANLESVLSVFFLDNNLYPVPRTGPLCQCHVIQRAYQWVHHHFNVIYVCFRYHFTSFSSLRI